MLTQIAQGGPEFAFVPKALRQQAAAAVQRAIACVLATQICIDGALAVWSRQYDP